MIINLEGDVDARKHRYQDIISCLAGLPSSILGPSIIRNDKKR